MKVSKLLSVITVLTVFSSIAVAQPITTSIHKQSGTTFSTVSTGEDVTITVPVTNSGAPVTLQVAAAVCPVGKRFVAGRYTAGCIDKSATVSQNLGNELGWIICTQGTQYGGECRSTLTLGTGETKTIDYKINIPEDAEPGNHQFKAVILHPTQGQVSQETTTITVGEGRITVPSLLSGLADFIKNLF